MIIFQIFVFAVLFIIAVRQIYRIFSTGRPSSSGLLIVGIFAVYGLPLVYQYFMAGSFYGLGYIPATMENPDLKFRYGIVVLIGVFLILLTSKGSAATQANTGWLRMPEIKWQRFSFFVLLSWLIIITPMLVLLLLAPNKTAYLILGSSSVKGIEGFYAAFIHNVISRFVVMSLLAYLCVRLYHYLYTGSLWNMQVIFATFLMIINIFLHGKRSIIISFFLVIGLFQMLEKRSRKTILIGLPMMVLILFGYISLGKNYEIDFNSFLRGDLSRDYTLYFTLDNCHLTYNEITEQRGNSLKWQATWFLPRRYYSAKGWPTSVYFTCAVFDLSISDRLHWGFGTGYYEEFLMNFGYLGLLLFIPLGLLLRGLDYLIYERSTAYCILWVPMLYNLMFGSNAAMPLYIGIVIPSLIVFGFVLKKPNEDLELEYEDVEDSV